MSTQEISAQVFPYSTAFTFSHHSVAHEAHPERNEDTILVERKRGLAAVLDGVGGAEAGDVASRLGAKVLRRSWRRITQPYIQPDEPLLNYEQFNITVMLQRMIEEARIAISREGERHQRLAEEQGRPFFNYPGTTLVLAVICRLPGEQGYILVHAHVGDSRIYHLPEKQPMRRLTRDDGYFTLKIDDQTLSEEQALRIDQATHNDQLNDEEFDIFSKRNGITQDLGHFQSNMPSVTIHTGELPLAPGDRIILCSDGIHDNLIDEEIEQVIRTKARTTVARHLVQHAQNRSRESSHLRAKSDDMSAIVISCRH